MASNNILLLEDRDEGQRFKELLEDTLNVNVIWVRNSNDAIKAVEENYIKVALLDQRLEPGELGTEIFKKIRKIQHNFIPIMLTSRARDEEVGEAINLKYYKYVNKSDTEQLPDIVLNALIQHNLDLASSKVRVKKKLIHQFKRKGINPFRAKYQVYLISMYLLDDQFMFDDKWLEILSVDAGKSIEKEHEMSFENTVKFENKTITELSNKYSIGIEIFSNKLKNELSEKISTDEHQGVTTINKKSSKIKIALSLPAIPPDVNQNYLASKSFQTNQVYEKHLNILEILCPECKLSETISLITYNPLPKVAKRQVDIERDGNKKIIDCGIVTIK